MKNKAIQKIIEEFLPQLGIAYEKVEFLEGDLGVVFNIFSEESKLLIGTGGANLLALNHIIKRMVEREEGEAHPPFMVDVNGYQSQHNKELGERARVLAERVKTFSSEVEMEPMSPYERMVVHSALAGDSGVETESAGRGRDRHVVIRPKIENI